MKIVKNPKTDADVKLLRDVFGRVLPDGTEIAHEQIEAVLRIPHASSRYRAVTHKWRRELFQENGVYLDGRAAEGRGFVALTPDQMIRFANRGVRAAGRKLRRMIAVASAPDDDALSPQLRQYRQALLAATERIAREHRAQLRDVSRSLSSPKQLPRKAG
jgi:hypothetical protein